MPLFDRFNKAKQKAQEKSRKKEANFEDKPLADFLPYDLRDDSLLYVIAKDQTPFIERRLQALRITCPAEDIERAFRIQDEFIKSFNEIIDNFIQSVNNPNTELGRRTQGYVENIFSKWRWELHMFLSSDFLDAKRDLKRALEKLFSDPIGFGGKTNQIQVPITAIKEGINDFLFRYLVVLVAKRKLELHKERYIHQYNHYGYEENFRSEVITREMEKEILERFEI